LPRFNLPASIFKTPTKTLWPLARNHVQLLRAYRKAAALVGYIRTLLEAQRGGRIHAAYSSTGAANGRFSCENPNLQNVPRDKEIRSCFVPSAPDRRLVVLDFGQIELRIAALIAQDKRMIAAFRNGEDLHRAISAACLRKPLKEVTPEERKLGKAVNFGFIYGQGPEGFQRYARSSYGVKISLQDAKRFRDQFFRRYAGIRRWHVRCWHQAKEGANTERTVFGRLAQARPPKGMAEATDWSRFNALTEYRVCGSAADLVKTSMVRIAEHLPDDTHLVACVHDELVIDCPGNTAKEMCALAKSEMEAAFVAMFGDEIAAGVVEGKVCKTWADK
jgi:DNA polymerase-1